ncbi:MAG: ParB N-terminal domain-containing protein [Thermoprotei archaeon]
MSSKSATNLNAARVHTLLYKERLEPRDDGAKVVVYTLPHVTFKGATVCLGFRFYYSDDAYKGLVSLIPEEFKGVIMPITMSIKEFSSSKDGYYVGGLVFLESDDEGGLYVYDPDTDGKVYLPTLVAYYPAPVYDFEMIPMDQIRVLDELRYRADYDIDSLAENIRRFGLLNPLIVFRDKKVYRLLAGYRRYYALRKLGWPRAPALILNMPPETQNLVPLIENFFRLQPSKEDYQKLVSYILNSYGGYTSIYDLLRSLHISDKRTVLRLLKEAGLEAKIEPAKVGSEVSDKRPIGDNSLFALVERLLTEVEQPIAAGVYDTEAIRLRIEALNNTDDQTEASFNGDDGVQAEPYSDDGDDDGVGVGLIEVPLQLLRRLTAYLNAKDAESFKHKLARLLESLVGSPIILVVARPDDALVEYAVRVGESSGGRLVVVEPAKIQ